MSNSAETDCINSALAKSLSERVESFSSIELRFYLGEAIAVIWYRLFLEKLGIIVNSIFLSFSICMLMKRPIMCLLAQLTIVSCLVAQTEVKFARTHGSLFGSEQAWSVATCSDGGFVSVGSTTDSPAWRDVLLTKTNSLGELEWSKRLGGVGNDWGHHVRQTEDDGFIITGWTHSFGTYDNDFLLIKTDASGVVLWTKVYGREDNELGRAVCQTSDGGYAMLGNTDGVGPVTDLCLIKTDAVGDAIWIKTYGSTTIQIEDGWWIEETTDGGFIVTGNTSEGPAFRSMLLVKFDSQGDTAWTRIMGIEGQSTYGRCVKEASNGDFIATGYTYYGYSGGLDVYTVRVEANGNLLWSRVYGGTEYDEASGLVITDDGQIVICGTTSSFGPEAGTVDNAYLLLLDANGDTLATKAMGITINQFIYSMDIASNGYVILAGWSPRIFGDKKFLLYKTNLGPPISCNETGTATVGSTPPMELSSTTLSHRVVPTTVSIYSDSLPEDRAVNLIEDTICFELVIGLDEMESMVEPLIYPNPTTGVFSIAVPSVAFSTMVVRLHDALGRVVFVDQAVEIAAGVAVIQLPELSPGSYFVQLLSTEGARIGSTTLAIE